MISPATMILKPAVIELDVGPVSKCPLWVKSRHVRRKKRCPALPPIATAKADFRTRSCPLYPLKRTCAVQLGMSALGQSDILVFPRGPVLILIAPVEVISTP